MTHGELATDCSPPFMGSSAAGGLYLGPRQREALATLRYGIEARKGLTLCVGDAGTGKSALLQRLAQELDASVTFVLLRDSHLSFGEILRSILRSLKIVPQSENEAELVEECRTILSAESVAGRIVAVAFDDAHHLRDQVITQLLQNFFGGGTEDAHPHLIQMVFAGRPELREKFLRPSLRTTTPVALECALPVLTSQEVGEYIKNRLRGAGLRVDLLDKAAVQAIAFYSGGKLQWINALCERAILEADLTETRQIGAGRIESAAKDLDLWRPRWVSKEEQKVKPAAPREHDEIFRFELLGEDTTQNVGQTFLHLSGFDESRRRVRSRRSGVSFKKLLLTAAILALPSFWVYGELAKTSPSDWSGMLGDVAGKSRQLLAQAENVFAEREEVKPPDAAVPMPDGESFPATIEERGTNATPPLKMEELMPPLTITEGQDNPEPEEAPKSPPQVIAQAKKIPQKLSDRASKDVASQISKAIENRAIAGVHVTVREDIAYLDGRVATERQRRAAERAARNVGEVRSVRNRIDVE